LVTNTVAVIIIIAATIFMIMTTNVQLIAFTQVSTTTIASIENAITSETTTTTAARPAVGIFDADSTPFGLTYGDWTARW
jgi:predicted secreted hydrolase